MAINIPQGSQTNEDKAKKRSEKKVGNKTDFDALSQKDQIEALRLAVADLLQAIEGK